MRNGLSTAAVSFSRALRSQRSPQCRRARWRRADSLRLRTCWPRRAGSSAGLEPEKQRLAPFAWDGPEWRGWNYFGNANFIKPGLRLEQMSAVQKAAAWDLLATLLLAGGSAEDAQRDDAAGRARRRR